MAMELRVLLLLPLCFPGLQAQAPDAEERRMEGSTLYIQCQYTQTNPAVKAWCRLIDGQWKPLLEVVPSRHSQTNTDSWGKITIEDDYLRKTISITMTNLQAEDSGTYSCAYRPYSYMYPSEYVPLKTISLNVFRELHKWELENLSVQCKYSTWAERISTKAWCRRGPTGCKILLKTDGLTWFNNKALEDRATIQDNTQEKIFTITMKKLQVRDAGIYWCAFHKDTQTTQLTEIRLAVSKRTQQYTAKESGNISVQCLYNPTDYGAVVKAWCKEGAKKPCAVLVNTSKSSEDHRTSEQDRMTIQDDTKQGIVTVTMGKLQAQDAGVYWCALSEDGQLSRMMEVTLHIPEVSNRTTLSGTSGTSQATPGNTTALSSNVNTCILFSGVLGVLFILALTSSIILYVKWRKQLKKRGNREAEDTYDKPEDIAQLGSTERMGSPTDDSKELKYATLNFTSQLSPEDTLYCNLEPSQAHRKARDENVNYAIIALKHLSTNDKG